MPGYHATSFPCLHEHAELLAGVLAKRFPKLVIVGAYGGGRLHYELDLDVVGDRLCAELMVKRELEQALRLHRMPSDPPPDEVA